MSRLTIIRVDTSQACIASRRTGVGFSTALAPFRNGGDLCGEGQKEGCSNRGFHVQNLRKKFCSRLLRPVWYLLTTTVHNSSPTPAKLLTFAALGRFVPNC